MAAVVPGYAPPVNRLVPEVNWRTFEYRSWSEYLDAAHAVPPAARIRIDRTWNGVDSWDEGVALAERGWPAGMEHVRAVSMPAVRNLVMSRPVASGWEWDVTGAAYDVGEYLSGVPECWLTPQVDQERPVVRIGVNLTTSAGVPQEVITMRGAGVVALTLALQASGYVVDVSALIGMAPDYQYSAWQRIPLSDANGGPLDVDRLVFALAHPASPRLLGYSIGSHRTLGHIFDRWGGWAQHPIPWAFDLFLGHAFLTAADWKSPASVSAWVQREYNNLTKGDN